MNGQRIVQVEREGVWANQKVGKAGALTPGIYNLYTAQQADKAQRYDGVIVYIDSDNVYQQIGKSFVVHARPDFDKVPKTGAAKSIAYDDRGKALLSSR